MESVVEFATNIGLGARPISGRRLVQKFGVKSLRDAIAASEPPPAEPQLPAEVRFDVESIVLMAACR